MKAVIMAGGSGTRLWPVSRKNTPKQGQPFGDNQTLLEKTYARLRRGFAVRDIWLSTSADQYALLKKQVRSIPRDQVIIEPVRRDTSAAIGLAATVLQKRFPGVTMATVWADSYIKDPDKYIAAVRTAEKVIAKYPDRTVLIGLKPRYADTGLGYLQLKRQIDRVGGTKVFHLDRFVEKPPQAMAERFVKGSRHLWNPGMFMFRVDVMLEKYRRWLPKTHQQLMVIAEALGTAKEKRTISRVFPQLQKIAIEYAIMEKDKQLLAIPGGFTWSDVGTWAAVHDMLVEQEGGNVHRSRHINLDSHGNLLFSYSDKLIATAGLENMILIETNDAILVCPRNRSQDVKRLVALMEEQSLHKFL